LIEVESATLQQEQHELKIHFRGAHPKISWNRACDKGAIGTEINVFFIYLKKQLHVIAAFHHYVVTFNTVLNF
jgi:hypothetical protein